MDTLSIDIETDGLDPWNDNLIAVGVAEDDMPATVFHVFDDSWNELPAYLSQRFQDSEVIVHNAAFDLVWLKVKMGIDFPNEVWDTMIAESLLTAGYKDSVSLADTLYRYFGVELDKSLQTSFTLSAAPSEEQLQYLRDDVSRLFHLRNRQAESIAVEDLTDVWYGIEKPVTKVFCEMIHDGVRLDVTKLTNLIEGEKATMNESSSEIATQLTPYIEFERIRKFDEMVLARKRHEEAVEIETENLENKAIIEGIEDEKEVKRFVREGLKEWRKLNKLPPKPVRAEGLINLSSPEQVKTAFNKMGIPVTSTKEPELRSLLPNLEPEEQRIVRKLLEFKKSAKIVQAFGDNLIRFVDRDGKIHSSFRQYGTDTGRPTSSKPNLLQMPSTPEFRSCFIPDEGHLLIVADFSQMELREMAQLSQDREMMHSFKEGLDLHTNTAALMYGVPYDKVDKVQRSLAKTLNFGILYGMGASRLRETMAFDNVHMSQKEAQDTVDRWRQVYSGADRAIKRWGQEALAYGYTVTAFGRRRRFDLDMSEDNNHLASISRQGANHVIQGTNADITKLAMVLMQGRLQEYGASIRLQVYDEVVVSAPEEHASICADIVYASMLSAAEEVLVSVPAAVDCVISTTWNEGDLIYEDYTA